VTIRIAITDRDRDADLLAMAARAALPTTTDPTPHLPEAPCVLARDASGLVLRARLPNGACEVRAGLLAPRAALRRRTSLLARAVGGRRGDLVIDVTCGLGRDAHELAALGYRVLAYERHPVLALLLRDAIDASHLPITLVEGDAAAALRERPPASAHAVYLDPMFPPRGKQASVKKEAEVLQLLVGGDGDDAPARGLLQAAWRIGQRVVVKRPPRAPPLCAGVGFVVHGRALRFDVYLTTGRPPPILP